MIEQIQRIINEELGVALSKPDRNTQLGGSGIGLDSQEIVDFTCMVEKTFAVKLPIVCFTKVSTLEDVIRRVQEANQLSFMKDLFEGRTESSLEMNCPAEMAYKAIYEMERWSEKLPHVKRIQTLYNDGTFQEFLMDVASDMELIQVRSIRRCTKDGILFFQSRPPKFLKHHSGGWTFHEKSKGCEVRTWHQWNLELSKAREMFPPKEGLTTQDRVANTLRAHAELALKTWKAILEAVV
jgi:acyl carrier protein